jgi:hypothetical protein
MTTIYLLAAAPGSGKTWVGRQVGGKFEYVENDAYIGQPYQNYLNAVATASRKGPKPVLAETPQSVSRILDPLTRLGFDVRPLFILESPDITSARYWQRENRPIPKQHLSLIKTYTERAISMGAPCGTSTEILRYLQQV